MQVNVWVQDFCAVLVFADLQRKEGIDIDEPKIEPIKVEIGIKRRRWNWQTKRNAYRGVSFLGLVGVYALFENALEMKVKITGCASTATNSLRLTPSVSAGGTSASRLLRSLTSSVVISTTLSSVIASVSLDAVMSLSRFLGSKGKMRSSLRPTTSSIEQK